MMGVDGSLVCGRRVGDYLGSGFGRSEGLCALVVGLGMAMGMGWGVGEAVSLCTGGGWRYGLVSPIFPGTFSVASVESGRQVTGRKS
jgi:hypothetical protein